MVSSLNFQLARTLLALPLLVLFFGGCDDGTRHYQVSGTVTVDGIPVVEGEIIFYPINNRPPDSGLLKNGAFSFQSLPGEMRVGITAIREHPTKKSAGA